MPDTGLAAGTWDQSVSDGMTFLQVLSLAIWAGPCLFPASTKAEEGLGVGSGAPGQESKSPPPGAPFLH